MKYKALLKGLEISEIELKDLEFSGRIDSEYYKKEYIIYESMVLSQPHKILREVSSFLIGPFGSAFKTENYDSNSVYRYIRGQDVKPFILQDADNKYLPEEDFLRLSRYSLKESDILVSVVGTLGNACLVLKKDLPAIFSCKSTVLRTKSINPVFLLTYLNSKYGRQLLLRKERGAIQKGLNLDDLKNLIVSYHSESFQKKIEIIFFKSQSFWEKSKTLYTQAEDFLLSELGLKNWVPSSESISIKSFLSSFHQSGRLDAEYYQQKYDCFFKQLNKTAHQKGWVIKELSSMSKQLKYGSSTKLEYIDKGVPFLRIADLFQTRFEPENLQYISSEAAKNEESAMVNTNDVLISRSGTLGLAVQIPEYLNNAIFGSYFIRIRPDISIINPVYLTLYLNSLAGQVQVEQANTGGIQTNLTIPAIEDIKIIVPPMDLQKKVEELIENSYQAKDKSKHLLYLAKRVVEIAIERGEDEAMKFMGEQYEFN